jgi:hypothetical protein
MGALGRLTRKMRVVPNRRFCIDDFADQILKEDDVILETLRRAEQREMESFYANLTPEQQAAALGNKEDPSFGVQIEKHPNRYPKHDGDKGQVLGGECNRTACKSLGATWFNKGTKGYYCPSCGVAINGRDPKPLCEAVGHQLTIAEQNELGWGC